MSAECEWLEPSVPRRQVATHEQTGKGAANFHGITLKKDEEIRLEAKLSRKALILTWASIPGAAAIIWIFVY